MTDLLRGESIADTQHQLDYLWHYTNLPGLMGIVQRAELWATDLRYLNDSTEFTYGLEQALSGLRSDPSARADDGQRRFLKEVTGVLEDAVAANTVHAYVVCFSKNDDHLGLWRGYGHQGYALGFERSRLEQRFRVTHVPDVARPHLQELAYSQRQQELLVHAAVGQHPALPGLDQPARIAGLVDHLYVLIGALKHPAFEDEAEIRLTYRRAVGEKVDVRFREGPLGPTPYLVLPLSDEGEELEANPLREIVVGPTPHPAEAAEGVRRLLAAHGLQHVTVRTSCVPLRW